VVTQVHFMCENTNKFNHSYVFWLTPSHLQGVHNYIYMYELYMQYIVKMRSEFYVIYRMFIYFN